MSRRMGSRRLRITWATLSVGLLGASWPSTALAHVNEASLQPSALWTSWNGDPWIAGSLLAAGWLYIRGIRRMRRSNIRRDGSATIRSWQAAAHGAGLATLAVALLSPLDALSAALFSAHMAQHILLMAVAPPLLILGEPLRTYRWASPASWRRQLAKAWHRLRLQAPARFLLSFPVALMAYVSAVWLWHAPGPYQAALTSDAVHALEHACFFGTALWVWSSATGRSHGAGILLLFGAMLQGSLLGALATVSAVPWYPIHAANAQAWGLSPLEDQQLAGLIMWIPGSLSHVLAILLRFRGWLRSAAAHAGLAALLIMGTLFTAAACSPLREPPPIRQVPGGDSEAGRAALARYGCGSCHRIPGVARADGLSAPPLERYAHRSHVAGMLSNNAENLIRWIQDPQSIAPGTAMPNLGVPEHDARDMAAYLYEQ